MSCSNGGEDKTINTSLSVVSVLLIEQGIYCFKRDSFSCALDFRMISTSIYACHPVLNMTHRICLVVITCLSGPRSRHMYPVKQSQDLSISIADVRYERLLLT